MHNPTESSLVERDTRAEGKREDLPRSSEGKRSFSQRASLPQWLSRVHHADIYPRTKISLEEFFILRRIFASPVRKNRRLVARCQVYSLELRPSSRTWQIRLWSIPRDKKDLHGKCRAALSLSVVMHVKSEAQRFRNRNSDSSAIAFSFAQVEWWTSGRRILPWVRRSTRKTFLFWSSMIKIESTQAIQRWRGFN